MGTARNGGGAGNAEERLARQLALQRQLAELSRRLIATPAHELEDAISEAIREAAGLAGADRTVLTVVGPGGPGVVAHFQWQRDDVLPTPMAMDADRFRWSRAVIERDEVLHVPRVADLPPEAAAEREEFEGRGVLSNLTLPLHAGERVIGFQIFECMASERSWPEEEIHLLGLMGDTFATALRRMRTENALRESEQRFRALAENATELVAELGADARFRYASPSFVDLAGHDPRDLLGTDPFEGLIHEDDLATTRATLQEAMAREGPGEAIFRLRHGDGGWRWFHVTGRAFRVPSGELRVVVIGHDVTARVELEEAVERQLEIARRIAELSRRMLVLGVEEIARAVEDALHEVADLAEADRLVLLAFGDGRDEAQAYEWCGEGIPTADPIATPWAFGKVKAGEVVHLERVADLPPEAVPEREGLGRMGVRSILWIPIRDQRRSIGFIGFYTFHREKHWSEEEITFLRLTGELFVGALRRRRVEEALRDSQAQLVQAQKMEAVGRLAGGIAHDFNNLLMVISGNATDLLEHHPVDAAQASLSDIRDAAERASSLTRQLLAFSRPQPPVVRRVSLNAVVDGLDPMLRRLLGENVELVSRLASPAPSVEGDATQYEQVLVNLALNSRDAMPDGGRIEIATDLRELSAREAQRRGLRGAGRFAVLAVRDDGHGMAAAIRGRVFEPFFTTKEPGKGTGLGLSIVYGMVQERRGAIDLASAPDQGTLVEIFLPLHDEAAIEADGPAPRRATHPGSETVLLVEDEAGVRRLVRRMLEPAGYRVLEAENGAAALERAASEGQAIDLLVTDVVMPRLGGVELAARLRRERPELRLVFLSGYPAESRNGDPRRFPDAVFLQKPFSRAALLATVREALDREA